MKLVSFLPVQEILIWPVHICCQGVVYLLVSFRHFFFFCVPREFSKYADTNIIEFQSSRRNILVKIHANIFVLESSSVLKYFYRVRPVASK